MSEPLATKTDPSRSLVLIRGLMSFPRSGEPRLVDCTSKVPFTIGGMSPGSLHYVRRRFAEISRRNPGPVTAEFSGYVRKAGKGYRIDQPGLVFVAAGHCVEPEEGGLDY